MRAAIFTALCFAACSPTPASESTLLGMWDCEQYKLDGTQKVLFVFDFEDSGEGNMYVRTIETLTSGESSDSLDVISDILSTGTFDYSYDGDKLTMKVTGTNLISYQKFGEPVEKKQWMNMESSLTNIPKSPPQTVTITELTKHSLRFRVNETVYASCKSTSILPEEFQ